MSYFCRWPDYSLIACGPNDVPMGYIIGKAEGKQKDWHGHVTAVTVSPTFRKLGVAKLLMLMLEKVTQLKYDAYFVDLFVRESNKVAIQMYERLGYTIYRRVLEYYSSETDSEDAFDMRKSMPKDEQKLSMVPLNYPVRPEDTIFE